MNIGEICTREVVTCTPRTDAQSLATLMRQRHVGDVVVVDEHGVPLGIVTDRDIVVQVVAPGVPAETVHAADLMQAGLSTITDGERATDAIWQMRSKGIRRLPVVDRHNRLIGMVTADDITQALAQDLTSLAQVMRRQVHIERTHRSLAP